VADEIAGRIEVKNLRGRPATNLGSRRRQRESGFGSHGERVESAMHDPDVLFRIQGDAGHGAEDPVIRQRLRPEGIDLKRRRSNAAARLGCDAALDEARGRGGREHADRANEDDVGPLHTPHLHNRITPAVKFLSEGRQYTSFGSVKVMKAMKDMKGAGVSAKNRLLQRRIPASLLFFTTFTLFMTFMPAPEAHDIPADVLVQMLVKPEGNRLRVLVRVPLGSMRDFEFSQRGTGYLDFARARPLLADAAKLWIANSLAIYEGQTRLAAPTLVATQLSLPSDRSFISFDSALSHVTGPPLPDDTVLPWNQTLLDVLYDYSISSPNAELSFHSELARLGIRTVTVLRFLPPDGSVRAFEYTGDPGLVRLDPRWHQSALRFVKLGFDHILDGIDHLLFLLCLVIPFRRLGQLVLIVTSFTVAHSITLIASAFNLGPDALWFPLLIETLIAMSIVYMALENIVVFFNFNAPGAPPPGARAPALADSLSSRGSRALRRRWMITFAFGLVHGFGFSFALRETLQFAGSHLLTSLLSFNVGVELGQLLVLGVTMPLLFVLFRYVVHERIGGIIISALVAHTAWHWMTDRGGQLRAYEWPVLDAAFFAAAIRWTMLVVAVAAIIWFARGMLERRMARRQEEKNDVARIGSQIRDHRRT
jgi:hypothetical protein